MAKIDDYLTIPECAELLGCDQSTVHRWWKAGKLQVVEKFGRTLIHRKHCKRPTYKDGRGTTNFGRKKSEAKP